MTAMPYKRKGEITVFMALILSVICLFILGLIDNVKSYAAKGRIILASDAAIRSVFAEYNKRLYEKYHLLYIDPSYKSNKNSQELVLDHFITYMSANLNQSGEEGLISLAVSQAEFTEITTLDSSRDDLYSQISQYEKGKNQIKRNFLLSYVKEVFMHAGDLDTDRIRNGEWEFLIYGHENDYMNISEARRDYESAYIDGKHISYEKFLNEGLEKLDEGSLMSRMEYLITEDMRQNGSPAFDFKSLIIGMEISVDITLSGQENVSVVKKYSYR